MNERDSEAVTGLLIEKGFSRTDTPESADLVLFNTCSVRDHAEQKILGRIGYFKKWKAANPDLIVGIIGCMAQIQGEKLLKKNPEIDLVCGPGNLGQIPRLVEEIRERRRSFLAVDALDGPDGFLEVGHRDSLLKGFVTIMTGCDNRCTYCIVPYARGHERSRRPESVLNEIDDLAARGFKEVTLLGQNVNGYGKGLAGETIDFVGLLDAIAKRVPGLPRIRFMTSHPKDAHSELFKAMGRLKQVCPHLHLPVQSGSDAMLKKMKRQHSIARYLDLVGKYRKRVPGGGLTTDFIVGFPGETEKDFEETLALVERVRFDAAYIFMYSPRPGTPAAKLTDDVPRAVKEKRHSKLLKLQRQIALEIHSSLVGSDSEVLFEGRCRRGENRWFGRTPEFKRVVVESKKNLEGQILKTRVDAAEGETLLGRLLKK